MVRIWAWLPCWSLMVHGPWSMVEDFLHTLDGVEMPLVKESISEEPLPPLPPLPVPKDSRDEAVGRRDGRGRAVKEWKIRYFRVCWNIKEHIF